MDKKRIIKSFLAVMSIVGTLFFMTGCSRETDWTVPIENSNTDTNNRNVVETPIVDTNTQDSYSFVWMTDTQFYTESAPEVYEAMTRWISENIDDKNIKFVFHTGDVVNQAHDSVQWEYADLAMGYLDKTIPYSILAGNHDLTDSENPYENFLLYFGRERFADQEMNHNTIWYYRDGEASAQIIDTGTQDYLALALGVWPDVEMIAWADMILKEHPEIPAILTTHDYMNQDGTLSDTGNQLFDELVRQNPNVHLVLCGHNHNAQYRWDELDDNHDGITDRTVYQLLADYQDTPNGGNGFMRLLSIDEKNRKLIVSTYSPYLNQYNCFNETEYPGKDHFEIDISDWFK